MAQAIEKEPVVIEPVREDADGHHGHAEDPNAAPMHHDIQEQFSAFAVVLTGALLTIAIAAGIIFGLVLAND
ncbi:MAG: hypothetical protein ACM3S1_08165 [Hyphomicrobiales bacterium]